MGDSTGAIRRHGEKLFAAAGVAFLLGGAAAAALSVGADDEIRRSGAVSDRLGDGLTTAPPPARSPSDKSPIRSASRPPVPTAGLWQMLRQPQIVHIPIGNGSTSEIMPEVRPLRMEPARDDIGAVTLAWTDDPATNVTIAGYIVERRDPDGRWTVVKETAAGERTYRDATVAPRRTYAWRVTPRVADIRCPDLKQGPFSELVELTTQADVKVKLKDVHGPAARVEIHKFHKGDWTPRDFTVHSGEPLGKSENVRTGGVYTPVEFTAGRVIQVIDERSEREEMRPENVYNAKGQIINKVMKPHKVFVHRQAVVFEDREGRRVELEKGQEY